MSVELTPLRYFETVARAGSITAAARELGLTQPSLSVAIQKLELYFDTTLLFRDRNGIRLTSTGRALLDYARQAVAVVHEAEAVVRGLEHDDVGLFTLGCPESLGAYFLPDFLREFMREAAGIVLSLWNAPSPAVAQAVIARDVDFGLAVNPRPHPDLVLTPLFDDATDVMVSTAAAGDSDEGSEEAAARLRAGPLIYVDHLSQSQQLLKDLAAAGLVAERELTCGDLEMVKSLALGGVGVAILPRRVARYGQADRLRRLHRDLPYVPDTICLISRGDAHRTQASRRLRKALVDYGQAFAALD